MHARLTLPIEIDDILYHQVLPREMDLCQFDEQDLVALDRAQSQRRLYALVLSDELPCLPHSQHELVELQCDLFCPAEEYFP